jgi:2'-5' RNA ligase
MVGAFPNERRPRVLYVGSRNQGGAFRNLAHRLRKRYAQLNFTFDDDAVAHVTIARVKGGSSRPLPRIGVGPVSLRVAALTLFESVSEERGTRYAVLLRAPLAVTASGTRASNVTE